MHVLQFGFDGNPDNPHLPHNHAHDGVVYTGTHDNDTLRGWLGELDADTLQRAEFYLRAARSEVPTALHRAALGSVAHLAVLPMQDLLELGNEARFNTPGTTVGNWSLATAGTGARLRGWRLGLRGSTTCSGAAEARVLGCEPRRHGSVVFDARAGFGRSREWCTRRGRCGGVQGRTPGPDLVAEWGLVRCRVPVDLAPVSAGKRTAPR